MSHSPTGANYQNLLSTSTFTSGEGQWLSEGSIPSERDDDSSDTDDYSTIGHCRMVVDMSQTVIATSRLGVKRLSLLQII